MISGGSGGGTIAPFNPSVNVDATATLGSGGGADWWGRASMVRRAIDRAILLAYYRSTGHVTNDGFVHMKASDDEATSWTAEDTSLLGVTIPDFIPAFASGSQDPGEPQLYECANGDLLLHTWCVDYGSDDDGANQWRSTDGGETWTDEGKITFTGGTLSSLHTFSTDDWFRDPNSGDLYIGVRTYTSASYTDCHLSVVKTSDLGATWDFVCDVTDPGEVACIEFGMEYIGRGRFTTLIRDNAHTNGYKRDFADLGATRGSLIDITSTAGIVGRPRIYTVNHLLGLDGWWKDHRLVATGFTQETPGSSQDRRNCLWFSNDRGGIWTPPQHIDTTAEDGGYGDMIARSNTDMAVVTYKGTLSAASLVQKDLSIAWT